MYLCKRFRKNVIEKQLNRYNKIFITEYFKCPSLKNLHDQNTHTVDYLNKHSTQNCALNNVYHISECV